MEKPSKAQSRYSQYPQMILLPVLRGFCTGKYLDRKDRVIEMKYGK